MRSRLIPVQLTGFRHSTAATNAAECAGEQDRFWPIHDLLYENQRDWQRTRRPAERLREYAGSAGLDIAEWESCYAGAEGRERTRINTRAARRLGVRGTPTFFINGTRVAGALPLQQFRQVLMRAEAEAVR